MNNQDIFPFSPLFRSKRTTVNRGYLFAFLFACCALLPASSTAQQRKPVLTPAIINYLKANAALIIPVTKQKLPYREKIAIRFTELGAIYNPQFPDTRNPVSVYNFVQKSSEFEYIGKSVSTFRSTVFLRNQGIHYGVWDDGNCTSLIEYKVTRVGENLEITGKVYSCLVTS